MKKLILILVTCLASLSGFSQLATVQQQTVQSVKLDTISARLIRGAMLGGATAANQVVSTASIAVVKTKLDTTNQSLRVLNTTLGTLGTAVRQDTMNARLLSIKKHEDTLRVLTRTLNTRIATNASVTLSGGTATLAASEAHVGQVGGSYTIIATTIATHSTVAYTSGDNIGGINTVAAAYRVTAGNAEINEVLVWDKENQKPTITIDFWNASPTVGTYTDNEAEVIFGDQAKWLGSVTISSSDYVTQGVVGRASVRGLELIIKAAGGSSSVYFTIATTSTPSYTTASSLIVGLGIKQN